MKKKQQCVIVIERKNIKAKFCFFYFYIFEKAITSLRITNYYSIFITSSNSRMSLLELSTDLSRRYVSFKVNPLFFKETVELTHTKKELLYDIIKWGSLSQRFLFKKENDLINYLSSIYDSIILKDIIERLGIKDIVSFNKILQYILDTESRGFSFNYVIKYLKQVQHEIANDTLYNYLDAFTSTFIINKVYRYDIHGKSILKTLHKYYANDLRIKQIKTNSEEINYSVSLENIIYYDLTSTIKKFTISIKRVN